MELVMTFLEVAAEFPFRRRTLGTVEFSIDGREEGAQCHGDARQTPSEPRGRKCATKIQGG